MSLVKALFLFAITEGSLQMNHNSSCLHRTLQFSKHFGIHYLEGLGLIKKKLFLEKQSQEREAEENLPALVH